MAASLLIELHFLPSIEYFCAIHSFDKLVLERYEHFQKQSYRNRCHVLTANGKQRITVPLVSTHKKILITDVEIDYGSRWHIIFWRTLQSAYTKAPYFEHYGDDLHRELFSKPKFLFDLNQRLLSLCLQWLRWNKPVSESVAYLDAVPADFFDARNSISAKKDFQERSWYHPQPYQQVFGNNFVPNLSLLDVIMSEGPAASDLVKASARRN